MKIDLTEREIEFIHNMILDYMDRNVIEGPKSPTMQIPIDLLHKIKNSLEIGTNGEMEDRIGDRYVLGFVDDEDETWCFVDLDSNYISIG